MARRDGFTVDRMGGPPPGALGREPSSAERAQRESAVRAAAIVAARGSPLPPAVLDFIVASSDWRQDQHSLEVRAAGIADHVVHDVRAPNWPSAHPQEVAAYLASLGRQFGDYRRAMALAMGEDARDGDRPASSARLDGISGADAALLARMRDVAIRSGLHWAADRPEILRMGEDAIRLFARTGFNRESFERLERVGFDRRQILRLVQRAEESGQDANELARTTDDTVRILGGGNPQREQEIRDALTAFHERPTDAGAWQRLDDVLSRFEREGTAEQQAQAAKQREAEERIRQVNAGRDLTRATADVATTTQATAQQETSAVVDDLNGPAPSGVQLPSSAPQPPQPTRHVAGPR